MPKESNNLRNKKFQSSRPYDVSNSSFVQRATSRVLDLLPHTSWLSRWLTTNENDPTYNLDTRISTGPRIGLEEFEANAQRSDSNDVRSIEPVASKRPKLNVNSPFNTIPTPTQTKSQDIRSEELSPIVAINEPSTSRTRLPQQCNFSSLTAPVSHLLDKVNAGDDCSESSESTSGCSSLLPQAQSTINQRMNEIADASGQNKSILPNSNNMSLSFYRNSTRRPSFNTFTFSSPRGGMADRSVASPFYSGRTMYGGASANNLSCMSASRRLGPTVRPIHNKNEQAPISSSAKKILDALEQFSTPILDAKRVPVTIGTKRKCDSIPSRRYNELNVPTTSDLLRVKRRERLQKSTSDARQISASSSYSHTAPQTSNSPTEDVVFKLREEDYDQSHLRTGGKLKTRWKERKQRKDPLKEEGVNLRLPNVALPLTSLPSIDIKIPPSTTFSKTGPLSTACEFSFSTPLQDPCLSSTQLKAPTVNFKFSEPLSENDESVKSDNNSNSKSVLNFNFVSNVDKANDGLKLKANKLVSDNDKQNSIQPAPQLKSGSVMDVLMNKNDLKKNSPEVSKVGDSSKVCNKCDSKIVNNSQTCDFCTTKKDKQDEGKKQIDDKIKCSKCSKGISVLGQNTCSDCVSSQTKALSVVGFGDQFQKSSGSWECNACLVVNKAEIIKCIACQTAKPCSKKETLPTGFGNMFKPSSGSWECESCLVVNIVGADKCIACQTSKPGSKKETVKTGFGDMFKPSLGSWECESCLVVNAVGTDKCIACQSAKTGAKKDVSKTGFGNTFKPPADSWECSSCMVVNKAGSNKCSACQAEHKVNNAPKIQTSGFGNLFKKPSGSWECSSCMVQNNADKDRCIACETPKPGVQDSEKKAPPTSQFSFGIPKDMSVTTGFNMPAFKPADTTETKPAPVFNFGMPNNLDSVKTNVSAVTPTFQFGIPNKTGSNTNETFTFGVPKKDEPTGNFTNGNNIKFDANIKSLSDVNTETKNTDFKAVEGESKPTSERKPIVFNKFIPDSKLDVFNSAKNKSNSIPLGTFTFGSSKLNSEKPIERSSDKNSAFLPKPPSDLQSVINTTQTNVLSTPAPVTSNLSSTLFKVNTTSSETKSMNPMLSLNSIPNTNAMNNAEIKFHTNTNENKINPFNTPNVFKPSFETFQTTSTASSMNAFGLPVKTNNAATMNKTFSPVGNTEQMGLIGQTTPNIFGSSDIPNKKAATNFFGSNVTSSVPSFPTFGSTNSFTNAATPIVPEAKPTAPALFTFGTPNKPAEQPSLGFGFPVAPTNAPTPAAAGFMSNPSVNSGFNFSPKVENKVSMFPTSTPAFGVVAPNTSIFGTPQPIQSFGEAAPANPVFAFGSANPVQQTPTNTVFGFGGIQATPSATPTASPAFVFGATPSVPAFDPNAKPTFNFTGGDQPSTFTATATATPTGQRKIRKAVRRAPTRPN